MERITLITPVIFTDRKSKAGNSYRAADVQGILHTEDGGQQIFAMMLMSPYGERGEDLKPGQYIPVTTWKVDYRDRKLTSEVVGFKPIAAAAVSKAA